VRHAAALKAIGRAEESNVEFARAVAIDSRAARGWQQLIDNDVDAASVAAKKDKEIAAPNELVPETAMYAVLQENELRFPNSNNGWRARMRSH
jgi:hypothetical protein